MWNLLVKLQRFFLRALVKKSVSLTKDLFKFALLHDMISETKHSLVSIASCHHAERISCMIAETWKQRRSQPKIWGGSCFRLRTVFCLEYRLSKHEVTGYVKNLGGIAPWLRPCLETLICGLSPLENVSTSAMSKPWPIVEGFVLPNKISLLLTYSTMTALIL